MENKCEFIDKGSGCLITFDGSCSKEGCFTYRLMQKLEKIKDIVSGDYEQLDPLAKQQIVQIIEDE